MLCGAAGEFYTPGGQRDIDESFLVMMNAYHGDLDFHFPKLPTPLVWEALVDTAEPTGRAEPGRIWKPGEAYLLRAHSLRAVHQPCADAAIAGATQRQLPSPRLPPATMAASAADRSTPHPRRTSDAAAPSAAVRSRDRPGDGPQGVRFRLWAPRAADVALVLDGSEAEPVPMRQEPDGWWSVTTDRAASGSRYRYRVDGGDYPDPASRYQPDGVHGASEVIDPGAYRWSDTGWRGRRWEEMVIYELHLGTFSGSGDFAGAISRLDDLVALGVTAIELMPIAQFPGRRNWGYDGVQLYAPASAYGRPEDLKALVEACHARGLAILLDVVYNHFGPEGNYLHVISPDFFTERHRTPWGAAINYDDVASRPVRDFMIENALYWLEEYNFDGLRLDAVHAIIDDSDTDILTETGADRAAADRRPAGASGARKRRERGAPAASAASGGRSATRRSGTTICITCCMCWRPGGPAAITATMPRSRSRCSAARLSSGFVYQGEPSPYRGGEARGEPSGHLPPTAFVSFLQNHDQIGNTPFGERITANAPDALVHAAVAIVLLSPQIPLLFMGEEWATSRPFMFFCDFEPDLAAAVREGRQREFAQFAEFGEAAAQGRIPDATEEGSFDACRLDWSEREREPHRTWLERYRRMLLVRRDAIVPRLAGIGPGGAFRRLGPAALRAEWTLGDGALLLLFANFGDAAVPLGDRPSGATLLYCTVAEPPEDEIAPSCAAFYLIPPRLIRPGGETR